MMGLPLAGRRIVVTRPKDQAEGLATLIRQAGGDAIRIPALEIREVADLRPFLAVTSRLDAFEEGSDLLAERIIDRDLNARLQR